MGESNVLLAKDLCVTQGGRRVIESVNLEAKRGETIGIMGASGVGKTSLLSVLCGLVTAQTGSLRISGQEMVGASDRQRSRIRRQTFGLVLQDNGLFPELTLGENVSLPVRFGFGAKPTAHYADRIAELFTQLEIRGLDRRYPSEVSGGQLQRAAIARAIVHTPDIVLADEPTSALDDRSAGRAIELLVDLAKPTSVVIVVTHDRTLLQRCQRIFEIANGAIQEVGVGGS